MTNQANATAPRDGGGGHDLRAFMDAARALADPNRVRALMALRGRELCVCQIVELLELAPSTVSKHMAILRQAYLVESRKDGRWIYYRRPGGPQPVAARRALDWLDATLARDPAIRRDARRLAAILKVTREELCRTQSSHAS